MAKVLGMLVAALVAWALTATAAFDPRVGPALCCKM
jgi:hypothetical protein